jgi:hypothetical protein
MRYERPIVTYPDLTAPLWTVLRIGTVYAVALIMMVLVTLIG